MKSNWDNLHKYYKNQNWIDKPNIFAVSAIEYFPKEGKVLELGAGQGQDTRFFAGNGYSVISTDISEEALEINASKLDEGVKLKVEIKRVDLLEPLPFENNSFDIVYSHLALHYFTARDTENILREIRRVLKPGGIIAFLVNSVNDPEHSTGEKIEEDYYEIQGMKKRYFSSDSLRPFVRWFDIHLLDELGTTYKDSAKGVFNLVRFVGRKPETEKAQMAIPFVGAIVEREHEGKKQILLQTRWKPDFDPKYSGTLELPAGVLDNPFARIYDILEMEIREETGLRLKAIKSDSKTKDYSPQGDDLSFGFRPFCCLQQLKAGRPWIGWVFICEVHDGELQAQEGEVKDVKWVDVDEIKDIFENTPEKFFTLELPVWEYYFMKF